MSFEFEKLIQNNLKQNKILIQHRNYKIKYKDIYKSKQINLDKINSGDVVALIGDFDEISIKTLLILIEKKTIIVPLTNNTKSLHRYYFENACVNYIIENSQIKKNNLSKKNKLLEKFKKKREPGLVLFSSGTTGRPKAILHSINDLFSKNISSKRPMKLMSFLLFDHIGGLNTLFYALLNNSQIIVPFKRNTYEVIKDIKKFKVELLPTTPTFLRMLLFDSSLNIKKLNSLKLITYGSELMDQISLNKITSLLPWVNFKQTYGTSETGILSIKSENRNSLWIKIDKKKIKTKIIKNILYLKPKKKMIGYLNSKNPFDKQGWYNTKDLVKTRKDGYIKIIGRKSDIISVGGLKILPGEIERVAQKNKNVKQCYAYGKANPITGQHVEIICEIKNKKINKEKFIKELKTSFSKELDESFIPLKISIKKINISHRFKRSNN